MKNYIRGINVDSYRSFNKSLLKVSVALDDLEPELVCVNLRTGKSDGMGVINCPTYSFSTIINLQAARKALSNDCSFAKGNFIGNFDQFTFTEKGIFLMVFSKAGMLYKVELLNLVSITINRLLL